MESAIYFKVVTVAFTLRIFHVTSYLAAKGTMINLMSNEFSSITDKTYFKQKIFLRLKCYDHGEDRVYSSKVTFTTDNNINAEHSLLLRAECISVPKF